MGCRGRALGDCVKYIMGRLPGRWEHVRFVKGCLGKGAKVGKGKGLSGSKRNKHGISEEKGDKSGLGGFGVVGGVGFVVCWLLGLVVVFLGSCLALFGCWQYSGRLVWWSLLSSGGLWCVCVLRLVEGMSCGWLCWV